MRLSASLRLTPPPPLSPAATLVKDEIDEARGRASSAAKFAASTAVQKGEKKLLVKALANDAATKGGVKLEEREVKDAKRRMSLLASEAAGKVEDVDAHAEKGSNHVVPEWQEQQRVRGSSVAMDAASMIKDKKEQKRKGSIVASDASKMAIVFGSAVHDHDDE